MFPQQTRDPDILSSRKLQSHPKPLQDDPLQWSTHRVAFLPRGLSRLAGTLRGLPPGEVLRVNHSACVQYNEQSDRRDEEKMCRHAYMHARTYTYAPACMHANRHIPTQLTRHIHAQVHTLHD